MALESNNEEMIGAFLYSQSELNEFSAFCYMGFLCPMMNSEVSQTLLIKVSDQTFPSGVMWVVHWPLPQRQLHLSSGIYNHGSN